MTPTQLKHVCLVGVLTSKCHPRRLCMTIGQSPLNFRFFFLRPKPKARKHALARLYGRRNTGFSPTGSQSFPPRNPEWSCPGGKCKSVPFSTPTRSGPLYRSTGSIESRCFDSHENWALTTEIESRFSRGKMRLLLQRHGKKKFPPWGHRKRIPSPGSRRPAPRKSLRNGINRPTSKQISKCGCRMNFRRP